MTQDKSQILILTSKVLGNGTPIKPLASPLNLFPPLENEGVRDFPGGPVARTLSSQ